MVELVDTLVSGTSAFTGMGVQVPPRAVLSNTEHQTYIIDTANLSRVDTLINQHHTAATSFIGNRASLKTNG